MKKIFDLLFSTMIGLIASLLIGALVYSVLKSTEIIYLKFGWKGTISFLIGVFVFINGVKNLCLENLDKL